VYYFFKQNFINQNSKYKIAYIKKLILYKIAYYNHFFKNSLFMQNNLLWSCFGKQLITISFEKTTYLCKTVYYDLF